MLDDLKRWIDKTLNRHLDRKLDRWEKQFIPYIIRKVAWNVLQAKASKEYNRKLNQEYINRNGRKAYDAATRSTTSE